MGNMGKVRRVVRETVAVLVDELGPEGAARVLERALAQLRGADGRLNQMTTNEEKPVKARQRTAASS